MTCLDLAPQTLEEELISRGLPVYRDSCVNDPPCVCRYPCVLPCLLYLGLWDRLTKVLKQPVFSSQGSRGMKEETRATPEVICVFPHGGAVDKTQYNVMI